MQALTELGLDDEPSSWRDELAAGLKEAQATVYDGSPDRLTRHATGVVMRRLRGRVPVRKVLETLKEKLEAKR